MTRRVSFSKQETCSNTAWTREDNIKREKSEEQKCVLPASSEACVPGVMLISTCEKQNKKRKKFVNM